MRQLVLLTLLLLACENKPSVPTFPDDRTTSVSVKEPPPEQKSCTEMYIYNRWMADPVTQRCAWYFNQGYSVAIVERNCEPILKLPQFAAIRHCWSN